MYIYIIRCIYIYSYQSKVRADKFITMFLIMTYHEFVGHLTGGFTNSIRPLSGFPCLPKSWLSPKKIVQMGEMLLSKPTRRQFSKNRKKCRINKRKETTSLEIPKCPYINTHKNLKTSNITKMDTPSSQKKIHMYPLHFRFN